MITKPMDITIGEGALFRCCQLGDFGFDIAEKYPGRPPFENPVQHIGIKKVETPIGKRFERFSA
jgi:hypothetical protein